MNAYQTILPISVYSHNKRQLYGVINFPITFKETIRFNSTSEIEFSVPQKYYDEDNMRWMDNYVYDKLTEDNLIYIPDDTEYFSCPVRTVGGSDFYGMLADDDYPDRVTGGVETSYSDQGRYGYLTHKNFTLHPETELFDIGAKQGYNFHTHAFLSNSGQYYESATNDRFWQCSACESLIPVSKGDIIYMSSETSDENLGAGTWMFSFRTSSYTSKDPSDHNKTTDGTLDSYIPLSASAAAGFNSQSQMIEGSLHAYIPDENGSPSSYYIDEFESDKGQYDPNAVKPGFVRYYPSIRKPVTSKKTKYMRFGLYNSLDVVQISDQTTYYPISGYIKILSGERRCSSIRNKDISGIFAPKLQWFVITNIEISDDGVNAIKTVTAHSYEYTLSKRRISLNENTCALYVPPAIKQTIESGDWIIDKVDGEIVRNAQTIPTGLLNQILDALPNWSIGHISAELMTRYRTINEVDNTNIYTFLMNDVQSAFQCYFVFDGVNQTISAYTKRDLLRSSSVYIHWDNLIKEIQSNNSDTAYATALRVHTSDNTDYGLGLINPTGNNTIYNFNYIKPQLDFIPENNSKERTLRAAIDEWEKQYNSALTKYRSQGKDLIGLITESLTAESNLSEALWNYRTKADEINIYLQNDFDEAGKTLPLSYIISDTPRSVSSMQPGGVYAPIDNYANYHSKKLYRELRNLARIYYDCKTILTEAQKSISDTEQALKVCSKVLTFNPNKITSDSVLTKEEAMALQYFIKEGDWTNSNIVFSDTYSTSDIYDSLIDAYTEAKSDLDSIIYCPQYEFSISMANIVEFDSFKYQAEKLRLGHSCNIEASKNNWIEPTLLEIIIDKKDPVNTEFVFATDYKRKTMKQRFADLFNTINQTNVAESTFTFEE